MITLKDIAQMADVSPSAVSRYLNGGSLSEEKSQRIRDAIAQTGYRPNQAAQTLRTGTLKQVGVIVPKINSNSVSNVVAGINSVMAANGYSLLLGTTAGSLLDSPAVGSGAAEQAYALLRAEREAERRRSRRSARRRS